MSSQGNDMSDHNENGMDRRRFVNGVGVALLTAQVFPWIAHTSASPSDGKIAAENLIIHSGPGFVPHTHDLLVPYALLKAPPREGVKLESTMSLFHTHDVVLSQEQLIAVNKRGTVTAIGGSHTFVIALGNAVGA
jgi:hypothetical protein